MRGPVEQLGCARRPVKAEVAGSNPVGTARTEATSPGPPGQVAQSVERAAENRKVGGSIPSLPTTSARVGGAMTGRDRQPVRGVALSSDGILLSFEVRGSGTPALVFAVATSVPEVRRLLRMRRGGER